MLHNPRQAVIKAVYAKIAGLLGSFIPRDAALGTNYHEL